MPALFLAIAINLNLNKWVYYKLKISAAIKAGVGNDEGNSVDSMSEESVSAQDRNERLRGFDFDEDVS